VPSYTRYVPSNVSISAGVSISPVVLVGESYWRRVVDIDYLVDDGVIDPENRDLFWFAETAQEIWDGIQHWHKQSGEPLPSMR
jgi:predicted Rossmann-fold nucleotide-binding protein